MDWVCNERVSAAGRWAAMSVRSNGSNGSRSVMVMIVSGDGDGIVLTSVQSVGHGHGQGERASERGSEGHAPVVGEMRVAPHRAQPTWG